MNTPWAWKGGGDSSGREELPIRRLHLGVDYGTSWSKLVFRDAIAKGGECSVVVRPPSEWKVGNDYRIPSLLVMHHGKMWFGHQAVERAHGAATIYPSMKMLMAFPEHYHQVRRELPRELSADDLAALTVLYLLQIGAKAAFAYLRNLDVRRRMAITIGAPMSQLDHPELGDRFWKIARLASQMMKLKAPSLAKGISIEDGARLLRGAEQDLNKMPPGERKHWVRSEAAAALLWAFRSPDVAAGLHASVDVGAGTTSVSWFRIVDRFNDGIWTKERIAFFGAACEPPGADAVEQAIAVHAGISDPYEIRGRANDFLSRLDGSGAQAVRKVCDEMFAIVQMGFRRAYRKEQNPRQWSDASLFLFGGGTRIGVVADSLKRKPWQRLDKPPKLRDPGRPLDLYDDTGEPFAGDGHNLLVAYGLSHIDGDIPEAIDPSMISDFKPQLETRDQSPSHEDLYSD